MITAHPVGFAWFLYGSAAIIYTSVVFRRKLPRRDASIFSARNARPLSSIFTLHLVMLAVLLYSVHMAVAVFPFLPDWLTIKVRRGATLFEALFIMAFMGAAELERRWMFIEKSDGQSNLGETAS
jgi:hypothetical protein